MKRFGLALMLALTLLTNGGGYGTQRVCAQTRGADPGETAPYNLVIIVLDFSRSFRIPSRAPGIKGKVLADEALRIVQQLIRDTANEHRRRTDGHDIYYIVAADAASQTVWSGTRDELADITPQELERKMAIREQFANCTDLEVAMSEVADIVRSQPRAAAVHVLIFSDLLHEPPNNSYRKCKPPVGEPPRGIEWKALAGAKLGFYFVSREFPHRPDQKWKLELERQELQAEFLDAAQALSAGVTLKPPPPPEYKPTDAQILDARIRADKLKNAASNVFTGFSVLMIAGIGGLFFWAARKRQNGAARRTR